VIQLALLLAAAAGDELGFPPARPAVPFQRNAEIDCDWVMKDPAEPLIRGSISRGEQSPVLFIVDPVFKGWSDADYPTVELSVGGADRRVEALAYVTHSTEAGSLLGIFLDDEVRAVVGGAELLRIWKDGTPVLSLALANTPSAEELAACVSEGD